MPTIYIAQYRGKSIVSKAIRLVTGSQWSHTAILTDDDTMYEAWHKGGVSKVVGHTMIDVLSQNHTEATHVDVYRIEVTLTQHVRAVDFLEGQVGKKYDFALLLWFITRFRKNNKDRWICSELAAATFLKMKLPLQRLEPCKMSPDHVGISPVIKPCMRIITYKCLTPLQCDATA